MGNLQKKYPFKFLDAYNAEDADIFFGREIEVETLYEMIFQTDLLLLYGVSGTGKTSLIQCGLASKFQSHEWLPLNIERGFNLNTSLTRVLKKAAGSPHEREEELDWLDYDFNSAVPASTDQANNSSLNRHLKSIYLRHFKPIFLIFDQFEELYILGDKKEQFAFFDTVNEILLCDRPVKIILSIREEYLGHLYEFERRVPDLFRKKLRIEPMNLDKVKTVVKNVSTLPQSNVRLAKGEEEEIAEGIFETIRGGEKTFTIQLPYLQVLLDKLYMQVTGDESRKTDALFNLNALQQIGNIGDVLRNFLDEQVLYISQAQNLPSETIWKTLSPFVTLDGTKNPLSETLLYERLPQFTTEQIQGCLQALLERRILRYSDKESLYEITHDSLAKQIHEKRSDEEVAILEVQRLIQSQTRMNEEVREHFTEKQLLFIDPYLNRLGVTSKEQDWINDSRQRIEEQKQAEKQRQAAELLATQKRLRKVWGLLAVTVLTLLLAIFFGMDAVRKKEEAEVANDKATKNLFIAYKAELARLETEINISINNINSYQLYEAEIDVIGMETQKRDSLSKRKEDLEKELKLLQK